MNINQAFTAELLRNVLRDLRAKLPGVMPGRHSLTWSGPSHRRHYFFQYDSFYWEGRASDANDARAKAWNAYMDKHAPV